MKLLEKFSDRMRLREEQKKNVVYTSTMGVVFEDRDEMIEAIQEVKQRCPEVKCEDFIRSMIEELARKTRLREPKMSKKRKRLLRREQKELKQVIERLWEVA